MKFRPFITLVLAGAALTASAQGYKDGIEYYKADRYSNAKELLQRNLNAAGTDKAATYYYLGLINLADKNTSEAKADFEKGIQANPDYAYNYVGLGNVALLNNDKKAAEDQFKLAEKNKTKKDAALEIAIARAYYRADPVVYAKEITKRIEKARKDNMNEPEIYMFEGDRFSDNKDWGQAAAQYEMATGFNPQAAEGYVKGAEMLMQLNPGASIDMLRNLLSNNKNSALGQRELANALYELGKYPEAAAEYGAYVNNPNHFAQDEDRYAFLLFYGGDYQKGYDYASKLLAANPSNFTARRFQFMNAAQLPSMKDQMIGMADQLMAAHKADKTNQFAAIDYTLIADEYATNDRIDDAKAVLQEALTEMPDNTAFYNSLAAVCLEANDLPGTFDAYKMYLSKTKEPSYNNYVTGATYAYYAGVQSRADDAEKAKAYFAEANELAKKAAADYPDGYKAVKVLGDVAKQTAADPAASEEAVKYYDQSLNILKGLPDKDKFKSDAVEMCNYAGIYNYNKKNDAKAREYFQLALEFDPSNEAAQKMLGLLK